MLRIDDISYSIAGRPLFEHASASIPSGHKVGLVGPNGTGKTNLFRLLRGELALDGGSFSLLPRAKMGGIGPEGLTLASGQFRNGILFAPLIADAAAQHVLQGRLPEIARPFAAGRFAEAPLL